MRLRIHSLKTISTEMFLNIYHVLGSMFDVRGIKRNRHSPSSRVSPSLHSKNHTHTAYEGQWDLCWASDGSKGFWEQRILKEKTEIHSACAPPFGKLHEQGSLEGKSMDRRKKVKDILSNYGQSSASES